MRMMHCSNASTDGHFRAAAVPRPIRQSAPFGAGFVFL
jgi:hypothetical protein